MTATTVWNCYIMTSKYVSICLVASFASTFLYTNKKL